MTNGRRSRSTTRPERPAIPRASSTTIAARISTRCRTSSTGACRGTRSTCGRCRCSTATAGALRGRWPPTPAPTSACARSRPRRILDAIRDARRDALLRRADRARHAHQCAGRMQAGDHPTRELPGRRGGAAGVGHRRHAADGLRHHARLRPDRDLRTGSGVRQAPGVGRARHRRAHRAQRPAGRALYLRGGHDGDGSADDDQGAMGRRDDGRDHVPRQHHDEGLSQERQGDRRGVRRRLVPLRRPGGDAAGRLRQDQGPLQGRHHLRRREHQLARGRGGALSPSRGARGGSGRAARSQMGRDAVRVRRDQTRCDRHRGRADRTLPGRTWPASRRRKRSSSANCPRLRPARSRNSSCASGRARRAPSTSPPAAGSSPFPARAGATDPPPATPSPAPSPRSCGSRGCPEPETGPRRGRRGRRSCRQPAP